MMDYNKLKINELRVLAKEKAQKVLQNEKR